MVRSEAQRAASRAFFAKWAPVLRQDGVGETWVDPALVGAVLYHPAARWRLAYRATYRSRVDGELYVLGEVVGQGRGTAVALGSVWSCRLPRLRRVVG